ncbi:hypothetical protein PIB30_092162, partial [Stylosanthes scabra]|nr:hypothetical protein [Stylosanthes scabra]
MQVLWTMVPLRAMAVMLETAAVNGFGVVRKDFKSLQFSMWSFSLFEEVCFLFRPGLWHICETESHFYSR